MKFLHATLRPGRVIEVLGSGNVKVEAPGLFSEEDKENLPPVYPFFGLHANSYSEPKEQDEVWVLNFDDNPLQLHWFRKDDRRGHNDELEGEENVEIICNREAGTGYATIYFSDGTGWMFRNGESFINIEANGNIKLCASGMILHVTSSGISLGSENKSAHPAAFGDKTEEALSTIASCFSAIAQAAGSNAYTLPIKSAIGSTPSKINNQASQVPSDKITLD